MPTEPVTTIERITPANHAWLDVPAMALGCAVTLSIYGYRFGEGNHTIYLLDALRRARPDLLHNDWFTTQTLHYHAGFGIISHKLIEWRAIEPVFFIGYLLLVGLFHFAWLGIVRQLGGGRAAYLVSLVLYYISAAGTGLGMYQLFQDSSFLPSNLANVALLWAVYLWIRGRFAASGASLGLAGLFHLNHAAVGVVLWGVLCFSEGFAKRARTLTPTRSRSTGRRSDGAIRARRTAARDIAIGSLLALGPAMINILFAARLKIERSGTMPLAEFIELYVRLRHPHHYDPASWPAWLWVSFLWSIPLALGLLWRRRDQAGQRGRQIFLFFLTLQSVALLGAGIWFLGEALVQMSLYRFSIYVQLLGCIVVAKWVVDHIPTRPIYVIATAGCAAMIMGCLLRGPFFGAFVMPGDDADYLAVCDWARDHAPVDAVFLVPPGEESMRLRGQRAIVVNYKAVPQLSAELPEWRKRLEVVLAIDDLRALPRGYRQTLHAIDRRYASLSAEQFLAASEAYEARFIVSPRAFVRRADIGLAFVSPKGRYFVYDRMRLEDQRE